MNMLDAISPRVRNIKIEGAFVNDIKKYTCQNSRAWDEIAQVRHQDQFPAATFFIEGGNVLEPHLLQAVGSVAGKSMLHLQCSTGSETLSWAAAGALTTGVDISPAQIEIAQQTATEAGLPVRFIAADVYDLPPELTQGQFDLVYTGGGAIVWLPELTRWAETIVATLRTGGQFILWEEHPLAGCLTVEEGRLHILGDYFGRNTPYQDQGWSHFEGGDSAQETKYEFSWPLGDVLTALAQAGLRLERLEEYPGKAGWRFGNQPEQAARLPGEYVLLARKD